MDVYFKLFNNIKSLHEVELARLEIKSLVGDPREVHNLVDELIREPLSRFMNSETLSLTGGVPDQLRFQDYLVHELPYGMVQGFHLPNVPYKNISKLVRRLAYTRELYIIGPSDSPRRLMKKVFPSGRLGENAQLFPVEGEVLLRIITNQHFLEKSYYISQITRNLDTKSADRFLDELFVSLTKHTSRIPATVGARVGKRLLDRISERREPSLYLFHGLHPYKGKFHPKMTRSLINIVHPGEKGTIIDHFAGSGTLLVEAAMMGLDSVGIELNPMSVLMSNAKCHLLSASSLKLKRAINRFLKIHKSSAINLGQKTPTRESRVIHLLPSSDEVQRVLNLARDELSKIGIRRLEELMLADRIACTKFRGTTKTIIRLGIAMAISSLKNREKREVRQSLREALEDICRRVFLHEKLCERLKLNVGNGRVYKGTCEKIPAPLKRNGVQSNVNSPPYSTALDYIKNDLSQLLILGLVSSQEALKQLENSIGGNPRLKLDSSKLTMMLDAKSDEMPLYATRLVRVLHTFGRKPSAFRFGHFFNLLRNAIIEQSKIIDPSGIMATVIGINLLKIADDVTELEDGIKTEWETIPTKITQLDSNVPSLDGKMLTKDDMAVLFADDRGIRVWNIPSRKGVNGGAYLELQNERVYHQLCERNGFTSELCLYRELQKSLRGQVRYETIHVARRSAD